MTSRWDLWQPGMAYVDFTNPDACKWYAKQLEGLMDIGVDTFKVSRCKPPEAGVISR
jgi:alpha-glucosidase (family GH31 glycosyl hydrolase)